jgi:hypothetical protein
MNRFGPEHIDAWRRDGAVIIPQFFTAEEAAAVRADFATVFERTEGDDEGLIKKKEGEVGRFHPSQFKGVAAIPFDCSPALNLIGTHPALMDFARQALRTKDIYLYQCQAWAKYTGESDYDQPFHCDFSNHTLTVPDEDAAHNSITILCYFSDVTDAHGAMHFVTRPDSDKVAGPEATLDTDPEAHAQLQKGLTRYERSSASPAGSIVPYSIDVYHRGTNMTAPGGHRFAVMVCYKRAHDDAINFHAWPFHHRQPWHLVFENATPEQLAVFGVQPPGHPFWTEVTIARAQKRYPGWDLTPYRKAMKVAVAAE